MKKILVPCALVLLLTACNTIEIKENEGLRITISAFPEAAGVRSSLVGGTGDDRNNVVFDASDKLAVFDQDAVRSQFSIPEGCLYADGSADFTGTVAGGYDRYYCVYPYSENTISVPKTLSGMTVYSELYPEVPSVQQACAGSFDPAACLSAGMAFKSGDTYSLSLSNLCALVKFSVPEGLTFSKAVLKAGGDEMIAGKMKVRIMHETGDIPSVTPEYEDMSGEITLEGPVTGGVLYYFSAIPQVLADGFGIFLYDGSNAIVSSSITSKSVELKRGVILNVGQLTSTASLELPGKGTSADPYLIYTYDQLALLDQRLSSTSTAASWQGKCYRQMADISCGGRTVGLGGLSGETQIFFTGTYDGNGFSVTDYVPKTVAVGKYRYSGLFPQVRNATVRNLSVRPKTILPVNAGNDTYYTAGALVGRALSDNDKTTLITGCTVLGGDVYEIDLKAGDKNVISRIGGLVGSCEDCNLTITGCVNRASVSVSGGRNINDMNYVEGVGGMLGFAESDDFEQIIRIDRCRNKGSLGDYNRSAGIGVGGMVGTVYEGLGTDESVVRISSCVNEGSLTAKNPVDSYDNNGQYSFSETYLSFAGGMVGFHGADGGDYDPYIYNCLNKGHLFAADEHGAAGGITGYCYDDDTTIALCVNVGTFSGEEHTEFGAISAMGNMGSWPVGDNARCIGCYWLDRNDSPADPVLPLWENESGTDPVDCYHYSSISSEHPANRIRKGWNTDRTEWDQTQWDECAGLWKGSAEYGQSLSAITLDLDIPN